MIQISVECSGHQQHTGESPVFVHHMVLKIGVLPDHVQYSIMFASHLVKDINNSSILRTTQ